METLRKRINVRFVNNEKKIKKTQADQLISLIIYFGKNYAAIHEIKRVLTTIYIGFTVLELSKWLMYDFHYSFIKKHSDDK